MNFKNWLKVEINQEEKKEEIKKLKKIYSSLLDPKDLKRVEYLSKEIEEAYIKNNFKLAEKLEVELENLLDSLESKLEDMDDNDVDDLNTGSSGGEDDKIDMDYSIQDEFARIYAKYLKGDLLHGYEDVEVDSSYRLNADFIKNMKSQGYALAPQGSFERKKIEAKKELAKILRSAVFETPYIGQEANLVKNMSDDQIIDAAKDAYESKSKILSRLKK